MYELNDTIVAVSSPTPDRRVIVRVTGPQTTKQLNRIFTPRVTPEQSGTIAGRLRIEQDFQIDALLYLFPPGRSYTAENLAEIHFWSNQALTAEILRILLKSGLRPAEPGEFTARAYLNGRLDLSQAEAVNKIITAGNRLQLDAAEKLLAGRLSETTAKVHNRLLQCLSLLEAGMDFSQEDIEFISRADAIEMLEQAHCRLEKLLSGGIGLEAVTDLPSVGIAGAPNAGKSSLLNRLLGRQRSIVSGEAKTTRDVLTGILELPLCRCVLFDCAGLIDKPESQIDSLAAAAAAAALNSAQLVLFCVDITKDRSTEDIRIKNLIRPTQITAVATKVDLLDENKMQKKITRLQNEFAIPFLPVSNITGRGLDTLRDLIGSAIQSHTLTGASKSPDQTGGVALTERHRQSVSEALKNTGQAVAELKNQNDEIAAMLIRAALQNLSGLERENIDEKILDNIFSRFCIGK